MSVLTNQPLYREKVQGRRTFGDASLLYITALPASSGLLPRNVNRSEPLVGALNGGNDDRRLSSPRSSDTRSTKAALKTRQTVNRTLSPKGGLGNHY